MAAQNAGKVFILTVLPKILERLRALQESDVEVTDYARRRAEDHGIRIETALDNLVKYAEQARVVLSRVRGVEGQRVEAYYPVGGQRWHKYILEVGSKVFLINVMVLNAKKQRKLKPYETP